MLQLNNVMVSCCQTEQNHYSLPSICSLCSGPRCQLPVFHLNPTSCLCDFRISLFRWPMPQDAKSASSPEGVLLGQLIHGCTFTRSKIQQWFSVVWIIGFVGCGSNVGFFFVCFCFIYLVSYFIINTMMKLNFWEYRISISSTSVYVHVLVSGTDSCKCHKWRLVC